MSKPYDFEYAPTRDEMIAAEDRETVEFVKRLDAAEPTNPRTGHHRDCICSLCVRI